MNDKNSTIIVNEAQSAFGYIHRQKWTHPALGTATKIHAAITMLAAAQDIITGIVQPDFARVASIKGAMVGATHITGNVVLTGTDIRGNVVTDTIALNDDTEVFGVVAFKTITNIHLPARTTAGDTVSIGAGDKLGLDRKYLGDECLYGTVDGTHENNRPVITPDVAISKNVIDFDTALANTKVYVASMVATERIFKAPTTA